MVWEARGKVSAAIYGLNYVPGLCVNADLRPQLIFLCQSTYLITNFFKLIYKEDKFEYCLMCLQSY